MLCQYCGNQIPEDALSCPSCGAPRGETQYCRHCGAMIDAACIVCPKCGKQLKNVEVVYKVVEKQEAPPPVYHYDPPVQSHVGAKNKWVALLLCLLFGWIGAHKFYEGRVMLGIAYALTCGLFGIGWVVDVLILLFKPKPYYL